MLRPLAVPARLPALSRLELCLAVWPRTADRHDRDQLVTVRAVHLDDAQHVAALDQSQSKSHTEPRS